MAANITTRINDALKDLFNIDDIIYQALICDYTGSIPDTISKPSDIDIGAMASMIEYMRLLSLSLSKQIYMDQSSGEFLSFILDEYMQLPRLTGETDEVWATRAKKILFQPKVSRAALISLLRPYSTEEPVIINEASNAMYSDCSFADRYSAFTTTTGGKKMVVYPANSETYNNIMFSIIIKLTKTNPDDYASVTDLLEKSIASGIYYTIQVTE